MHEPFEHVEARALEIAQLKQVNLQLQQSLNAVVEVIKDEPEAKQQVQPGLGVVAQAVAAVIGRLKRSIMLAKKEKAETNGKAEPEPPDALPDLSRLQRKAPE